MGFGVPIAVWFRHRLVPYARRILLGDQALKRGWWNPPAIQALLERHQRGRVDESYRIWSLLMLDHWCRIWLEGESEAIEAPSLA